MGTQSTRSTTGSGFTAFLRHICGKARAATEPVQTTVVALAPESTIRPWSAEELREIDAAIADMLSVGKAPRLPGAATEEVRRERLAAGPLDTANADRAIERVYTPVTRRRMLRSVGR